MAKKKKPTKGRKSKSRQASPVWQFIGAIILILAGVFIMLGSWNTGGPLPLQLFAAAKEAVGLTAYVLPIGLIFWGVYKLVNRSHHLARGRFWSLVAAYLFAASFLHVAGATPVSAAGDTTIWTGSHGGDIGSWIGNFALRFLEKLPAAILFLVFLIPTALYAFGIPFDKVLDWLRSLVHRPEDKHADQDLLALKKGGKLDKIDKANFKINEGLAPAEPEPPKKIFGGLKNSAERGPAVAAANSKDALTTTSDPDWQLPPVSLLNQTTDKPDAGDVNGNAAIIQNTFRNFNIEVDMEGANIGPRVTQYTLKPPTNVKLTKITALDDNLALDLAAHSIRIEAPIPGKRAVGIEVPNTRPATVRIGNLFGSAKWQELSKHPLGFVIGKDISGEVVTADLAKMPHILVAGQTGSGKSVMINTFLTSLLYHNSPSQVKLILVDPKRVEMAPYNDIPHLLAPVINEPEKCISALKWAVAEMERRYSTMAELGKRNIEEYNAAKKEEGMPYIVIVIDELADLMMLAARDVEALIVRLAQKARAVGIHLVLATQRPSVDVITGLIKANVPARVAFTVASQVDSRTIIDQQGAEKLLGKGDMLLLTSEMPKPKRIQAALIEEKETAKVTDFVKMQRPPQYDMDIVSQPVTLGGKGSVVSEMGGGGDAEGDMFKDAVRVVIEGKKASTSLLQRRLRIGYGRAARLIEEMEEQGIIGAADGSRPREVLVSSLDQVFGGGDDSSDDGGDQGQGPIGSRAGG